MFLQMYKNINNLFKKLDVVYYLAYRCLCLGLMTSISINYFCWEL